MAKLRPSKSKSASPKKSSAPAKRAEKAKKASPLKSAKTAKASAKSGGKKTLAKSAQGKLVRLAEKVKSAQQKVRSTVSKALKTSSSKDLKNAAQAADRLSQGKPQPSQPAAAPAASKVSAPAKAPGGRRGRGAQASVYTQSLSSLNRTSGTGTSMLVAAHPENVCREVACEQLGAANGYCRMHYIKNWGQIKRKEVILKEKKLDRFIEEIVTKYPDRHLEAIRMDLLNERAFAKVVSDLELEGNVEDVEAAAEADDENESENVIDTIRRDFDGEAEGF